MTPARTAQQWMEEFAVPEPNSGCWLWIGAYCHRSGYGRVKVQRWDGARELSTASHRLAYLLYRGPIPDDLQLDHLCRNRICCNPDHLEPVTSRVNNLRAPSSVTSLNSAKTHCPKGHPYDATNTLIRRADHGRACRACERARKQANPPPTRSSKPLPVDDPRHGSPGGYRYWQCRCAPCVTANRQVRRAEKVRAQERKASDQ